MKKKFKVLTGSLLATSLVFSAFDLSGSVKAQENVPYNVLSVKDESGDQMAINGKNQLANDNKLILFNDEFSYYTETQKGSMEVVLEKTGVNTYRVVKDTDGDSAIPEDGLVLSTGDISSTEIRSFLTQLEAGESVTLYEPTEKREQKQSNAVDPTRESNPDGAVFDGFRGPDQLIVYKPAFGESTKTNQYGYEITVENGFVTKLGGGNSKIPKNGFVVSGHGVNSSWISSNSIIGAKVKVSENVVEIVQDVESFQYQSQQAIDQARSSIEKAKSEYLDVAFEEAKAAIQKAESLLAEAEAIKTSDPIRSLDKTRQATQSAYDAYYYSLASHEAEQRAIWYRPEETTLAGVNQVLDRMEKAGFNSVYLETTFWGYTIYPSDVMKKYGLPSQHPRFANGDYGKYGKDLLAAYVKEGKKRGMTIQAWTDGFMIGESSIGVPSQFAKYPEWAAIQRNNITGTFQPDTASKYYWLDIAQPDVQDFMLDIYKEMQADYDIKGLNIDYMRYPHHKFEQSYGFSERTKRLYQEKTGIDPYTLSPTTTPAEWEEWLQWLRDRENEFVDKLHVQTKGLNKKFMLTATPEPGPEAVQISDWKEDIDGVIPQAYGHDFNSIQKTVTESKKLMPKGTMYYTGIYSFYHHLSEMASVNDVISAKYGTSGVNMFAFGQASAPSVDALGKGPWREKAINPGEEPILASRTVLKDIEKQIMKIYIPQGAVNKKEGLSLKLAIKKLNKVVEKDIKNSSVVFDSTVAKVEKAVADEKLAPVVGERMKADLLDAKMWVNYALKHQK
ncbi:glycoside hydrolase family 10 protein [Fictibacillus norfolkensis]|uniref:Family 10 glycosylhydrolase n=1 Tax=Fictibacillus norfolkensis TaxID=2762233 RepID=A0ABR8SIR7_9BACL|nr:family 10 glycosylhydrolase [Fictibacillus norfolkensis]MBD7963229.1 family 10 glycosylhydrolase [Fictibacillus norfolkensis]